MRTIHWIRTIVALPIALWGIFLILIAYGDYVSEGFDWAGLIVVASLGGSFLLAAYALYQPEFGIHKQSGKPSVIYTWCVVVLFFLMPPLVMAVTKKLGGVLFTVYENGFVFGPMLVSLVLAFNLRQSGLAEQKRYSKHIFILLLVASLLVVGFILFFIAQLLSGLP